MFAARVTSRRATFIHLEHDPLLMSLTPSREGKEKSGGALVDGGGRRDGRGKGWSRDVGTLRRARLRRIPRALKARVAVYGNGKA